MTIEERIKEIRKKIFLISYISGTGHLGSSLSCVEMLYSLYIDKKANISKENLDSPDRDKIILSKGHGSMGLYAILAEAGIMKEKDLYSFAGKASKLGGEPNRLEAAGIEATTGALGHGFPVAVGMAYADKLSGRNSKTYVVVGDGEMEEGSMWEAVMTANKYCLDNLLVLLDCNKLQKMTDVESIIGITSWKEKFESFGWDVLEVMDGHNLKDIEDTLDEVTPDGKPTVIIFHTIKGKGISIAENNPAWHFKQPKKKELKAIMEDLNISEEDVEYAKSLR